MKSVQKEKEAGMESMAEMVPKVTRAIKVRISSFGLFFATFSYRMKYMIFVC